MSSMMHMLWFMCLFLLLFSSREAGAGCLRWCGWCLRCSLAHDASGVDAVGSLWFWPGAAVLAAVQAEQVGVMRLRVLGCIFDGAWCLV